MPTYTYPGVYIEEQPAVGPITGVGTSTAAFIGPADDGPIGEPTKITNRTQFFDLFGDYVSTPRIYLAHAVDAFFANGGTVAYVVRVGSATKAFRDLYDKGGAAGGTYALRVKAKREGTAGNQLSVQVDDLAQIVTGAQPAKPTATVLTGANDRIRVTSAAQAANFRPGDVITIDGTSERAEIDRIRGDDVFLTSTLGASYTSGTLRIANLIAGQSRFRLQSAAGLEAGSAIRLTQGGATEPTVVSAVTGAFVTVAPALTGNYPMGPADTTVTIASHEFTLTIRGPQQTAEVFPNLAMDVRHSRYYKRIVNSVSVTVDAPPANATLRLPPENRPELMAQSTLQQGTADNKAAITAGHYQSALDQLAKVEDVNMVVVPDRTDATVQGAVLAHCQALKDRFAILDSAFNAPPFGTGSVITQRAALESPRGFAGLYYPWVSIADPQGRNGDLLMVPPSGHVAGIFARSDATRGVHKAPANELLTGALGLERVLDQNDHGQLNIEGINLIRTFPNRATPTLMGARTTAPTMEPPWRYVNVRRLMSYIEESIELSIGWAVFEPNDIALWQKLTRTISEFLTRVWRDGALFGAAPEQAFYVKCDEETNPPSQVGLGMVVVEIGVAPVRPAEFVVIRIGQWQGGGEVTEP